MIGIDLNKLNLITNNNQTSFLVELINSLNSCKEFYFSVAFINYSGLQLLLDTFDKIAQKNVNGKIITSTYLNFTDVKSLEKLRTFKNVDTKIYAINKYVGFHSKAYIFEYDHYYKIIVGSSNITQSALKTNIEWNMSYISKTKEDAFSQYVLKEFELLWQATEVIDDRFIEEYKQFMDTIKAYVYEENIIKENNLLIRPNSMQKEALINLNHLRTMNQNKALVVAATGTGKTYLSAFDVKQYEAKKVLFLVHREVILNDAMKSYERIHADKTMTLFQGIKKVTNADITFAMIPSMYNNQNYKLFAEDEFDYIIADEAHRSYSTSYRTLLEYFKPEFLLGMTATPERTDGGNIFALFNNNIALELRLRDALKEDIVIPFHYFGIKDVTTDLSDVDISKIEIVAQKLSIKSRVDLIIEKLEHYGFSGEKRKCLGFCASKDHAEYMAKEFNAFGYKSVCLTGSSSDEERRLAIEKLENLEDALEFIFTIDIFNEGVDIPSVNLVLLLRPTQSPIIFTQQLGRGLRKHHEKEFLTVLDFIGNHNQSFLIPIALSGSRYYDRDSLKVQVAKDFEDIPGCTHIYLESIVKEQILNQLERVNFNAIEYLKKEYFEFKKVLRGKTPSILDHVYHDHAPDPVKFIAKEKSYIEFVSKMEKSNSYANDYVLGVIRSMDKMLPIKRINEFVIIKYLLQHGHIDYQTAHREILKVVNDFDEASLSHSFKYLSGSILGPNEINQFDFIEGDSKNQLRISNQSLIHNETMIDTLNYGILRYQEEFGKHKIAYPYLKRYARYKMKDLGYLTNYEKSFSSIRGSGVWKHKNHYYLFVDLHKGENIRKEIDYKDNLLSQTRMQWETQNKTGQDSVVGKDLTMSQARGVHLHMFIRKAKIIGNQKLDYIYIGEVRALSYAGNKPITIQMEIVNPLPKEVFDDLTLIIE